MRERDGCAMRAVIMLLYLRLLCGLESSTLQSTRKTSACLLTRPSTGACPLGGIRRFTGNLPSGPLLKQWNLSVYWQPVGFDSSRPAFELPSDNFMKLWLGFLKRT